MSIDMPKTIALTTEWNFVEVIASFMFWFFGVTIGYFVAWLKEIITSRGA